MIRLGTTILAAALTTGVALGAGAHSKDDPMAHPMIFWGAGAEVDGTDAGWLDDDDGTFVTWDAYAWVGGDDVKVRIETEGEAFDGKVEDAELRGFVSWNIAEFWDVQAGLRYDIEPDGRAWAAIGFHGMATYFFETDSHLYVSDEGDVALRLEQSIDFALTQDVFLEPSIEVEAYADDMPERGIGAGLSRVEAGLALRYEVTRKFAPYVELVHDRALGETALRARATGEDVEETTLRLGLRVRL